MENWKTEKLHEIIKLARDELDSRTRKIEYEGYGEWIYDAKDEYLTIHDARYEYNSDTNHGGYNMTFGGFAKRFRQDFLPVTTRTPEGRRTIYKRISTK